MRKIFLFLTTLSFLTIPSASHAYFGGALGVVDKDNFGYGLVFGASLPYNLGLDVQIVGFYESNDVGPINVNSAFIQSNADVFYDFHSFLKSTLDVIELHPYIKAGFTYGVVGSYATGVTGSYAHGPGFNFGGGVDWKIAPFITVGIDLSESIIKMSGEGLGAGSLGPVSSNIDTTNKVFNALAVVKLFAY